jgi:hypothetical protein
MTRPILAVIVLAASACTPMPVATVEVHILPPLYVVDGKAAASASEAAKAVAQKEPRDVKVTACAMMPTKRITDFMTEVGSARQANVSLNVFDPGAPQCPK